MSSSIVTWSFPTTVVFGNGSISVLPQHVQRAQAKRALIVADPGVVKAQIADRVRNRGMRQLHERCSSSAQKHHAFATATPTLTRRPEKPSAGFFPSARLAIRSACEP